MIKLLRPISFLYLSFSCTLFAQQEQKDPQNLRQFCASYHGQNSFLDELSHVYLKDQETRISLIQNIRQHQLPGCSQAFEDYLGQFLEYKNQDKKSLGFENYLMIALSAEIPIAKRLIENQINRGKLLEWLDVFQQSDKEAYFRTLSQWVSRVAELLRQLDNSPLQDLSKYGHSQKEGLDLKTPEAIAIWNPILIDRYLHEIQSEERHLTQEQFSALNVIFAASNQSYRDIFLIPMTKTVDLSIENWVKSFREEPVWIQFRLLALMGRVGGGMVKRELIWLSKNHENFKIRSLAQSTLNKVNHIE